MFATCPVCDRAIIPGIFQVNSCRAFYALDALGRFPGLSAWELAEKMGERYAEFMDGLNKARAEGWVRAVKEDRDQGGFRYRYYPAIDDMTLAVGKEVHLAAVRRQGGIVA